MRIRDVLLDWDAKDVRGILVAIVAILAPVYLPSLLVYVSTSSVLLSSRATDFLYSSAARASGTGVLFRLSFTIYTLAVLSFALLFVVRKEIASAPEVPSERKRKLEAFLDRQSTLTQLLLLALTITLALSMYLGFALWLAFPVIIHDRFSLALAALGPYISDHDRLLITSKWVLMRDKADNDAISQMLEGWARANGIVLPRP